jgi:hypothetical protein
MLACFTDPISNKKKGKIVEGPMINASFLPGQANRR